MVIQGKLGIIAKSMIWIFMGHEMRIKRNDLHPQEAIVLGIPPNFRQHGNQRCQERLDCLVQTVKHCVHKVQNLHRKFRLTDVCQPYQNEIIIGFQYASRSHHLNCISDYRYHLNFSLYLVACLIWGHESWRRWITSGTWLLMCRGSEMKWVEANHL